jgi:hypothetical protein
VPVLPVEASLSEHVAVLPPLLPPQLHDHGPLPLTAEAVPAVQRFAVGLALTVAPFEEPHAPLTAVEASLSEQVAVLPPLLPAQLHDHGPLPLTAEAVPAVQRFAVGLALTVAPFEEPQAPLTAVEASLSEHVAVLPPSLPAQLHDHGPLPLTVDAAPAVQRFAVGLALTVAPFEEPQAPLTAEEDVESAVAVA